MADNVNGILDSEIDKKLKKIMEQRNIHNEVEVKNDEEQEAGPEIEGANINIDGIKREFRKDKRHPLNQIIYGAPGTGKTYATIEYSLAILENREINSEVLTDEERMGLMKNYEEYAQDNRVIFTTFHQSYGYEDFIQGIRPTPISEGLHFENRDGVFKEIADRAIRDYENNYVVIIDEINRGNISKIFGELITLIEDDKRWGELNQMMATLPSGGKFAVPNNLYIIGTMNSADKSISLIDSALRRRFEFVEMTPDPNVIWDADLKNIFVALNAYLRKELRSTDLLIGHSYFIKRSINDLESIMNRNVIPLLYEYFYDDVVKVKKALECISDTNFVVNESNTGRIRIKEQESDGK